MLKNKFTLSRVALCTAAVLMSATAFAAPVLKKSDLIVPELTQEAATGPATRFIVTFKSSDATQSSVAGGSLVSAAKAKTIVADELSALAGEKLSHVREMALAGRHVVKADRTLSKAETKQMLDLLAQNPNVASVEEDKMMHALATPNDAQYTSQWHYYEATGGMRVPAAWDLATGTGVVDDF